MKENSQKAQIRQLEKHILPVWGSRLLSEASSAAIQQFLKDKREGRLGRPCSPAFVADLLAMMGRLYKHALRLGFWEGSLPTEFVPPPEMRQHQRPELSAEQLRRYVAEVPRPFNAWLSLVSVLGIAQKEASAPRWKYVNYTDELARVGGEVLAPHTIGLREKYIEGEVSPLSLQEVRDLPLPLHLARELEKCRVETRWNRPEDFVFANENGNPHDLHNIITRHLKPAADRAKVPWISPDRLRWTAGSLMAQEGMNPLQQYRVLRLPLDPRTLHPSLADFEATRQAINRLDQKIFGNAEIPKAKVVTLEPTGPKSEVPASSVADRNVGRSPAEGVVEKRRVGCPTKIPKERKLAALQVKREGVTNRECAKILYDLKHPTPQQVKNVPAILKHFIRSNPSEGETPQPSYSVPKNS